MLKQVVRCTPVEYPGISGICLFLGGKAISGLNGSKKTFSLDYRINTADSV